MSIIVSDIGLSPECGRMLEGYDCPAILVSPSYEILATNRLYTELFGKIERHQRRHCYEVSHGYSAPCDQSGEDCPLAAAKLSGHKERVLHIHQSPRGREHVDVEMLPIMNDDGELMCFVELLKPVPTAGAEDLSKTMIGQSPAFNHMLEKIARVAATDASVLLLGESGTGKELAANAIHRSSTRQHNAMVTLECAGLTDSLFESELFGHIKGAFTGANNNKKGLVEIADGGTLFLDEIGDIPLSMQVKLLRLLETGTFRAVGSSELKKSNFRLVCATHKNLALMVKSGEFRQDLFYRINVFPIRLPSLAQRQEDLAMLAAALLQRLSPKKEFFLTDSALTLLKTHHFSGNIRELRNLLNRAIVLSDTNLIEGSTLKDCLEIDYDHLSLLQPSANPSTGLSAGLSTDPSTDLSTDPRAADAPQWVDLKTAENDYLRRLMHAHNHDKSAVAKIAGISLRSLYRKLEEI